MLPIGCASESRQSSKMTQFSSSQIRFDLSRSLLRQLKIDEVIEEIQNSKLTQFLHPNANAISATDEFESFSVINGST